MDTETTNKPAVSFDVFAVSKEGFEIHFALHGGKAYCSAVKLLETMQKDGFTPRPSNGNQRGSGRTQTTETGVCTIHNTTMKCHTNEKGSWYSHKLADGTYCNGKAN